MYKSCSSKTLTYNFPSFNLIWKGYDVFVMHNFLETGYMANIEINSIDSWKYKLPLQNGNF